MNAFTWAWIIIIGSGLLVEAVAIWRKAKGDTLTEHVRPLLRKSSFIWVLALAMGFWAVVHLFAPTFPWPW